MTIDEAIAHEKRISKDNKVHNFENIVNYHKQLAEWMEELKFRRILQLECEKEYFVGYEKGKNEGYNMAIDDFRDMLLDLISNGYEYPNKQFLDGVYNIVNDAMVDVAEQLKEREVK